MPKAEQMSKQEALREAKDHLDLALLHEERAKEMVSKSCAGLIDFDQTFVEELLDHRSYTERAFRYAVGWENWAHKL